MKHFIGLDVSMKETSICIVNEQAKVVYENTAVTDPDSIAKQIQATGLDIEKVGVESGSISNWLVTELQKRKIPAICIDSRQMGALLSLKVNKTDRNDARVIADAMRANLYQEVHLKSARQVDLNILLNARKTLVNQRTTMKNTIRGLLKASGVKELPAGKKAFLTAVKEAIKLQDYETQLGINAIVTTFELLSQEVSKMDKRLEEIAKNDEDAKLLMTIPGVGVITALTYLIAIGDVKRFKESRTVGAYFGMAPKQYSSGEMKKQGRISKCGHSTVRSLLVEAGTVILSRVRGSSKLKAWGMKIMRKKGRKKAAVAVGRKLAVIMHRMLTTREKFRLTGVEKANTKEAIAA